MRSNLLMKNCLILLIFISFSLISSSCGGNSSEVKPEDLDGKWKGTLVSLDNDEVIDVTYDVMVSRFGYFLKDKKLDYSLVGEGLPGGDFLFLLGDDEELVAEKTPLQIIYTPINKNKMEVEVQIFREFILAGDSSTGDSVMIFKGILEKE